MPFADNHFCPVHRITFFQKAVEEDDSQTFDLAKVHELINKYVFMAHDV
jgi:hypothetical protein